MVIILRYVLQTNPDNMLSEQHVVMDPQFSSVTELHMVTLKFQVCAILVSVYIMQKVSVGWRSRAKKRLPLKCLCGTTSPQARYWGSPSAKGTRSCTTLGYISVSLSKTIKLTVSSQEA